jgi:DNA-directed RNA polymerase specialized sigma24 family protein
MNPVVEEKNELLHYGVARRSGRYPYGSGKDPYQRTRDFLGRIEEYQKQGMSEVEIAKAMGIVDKNGKPSTGKLRTQKKLATNDRRILQIETAERLRDKEGLGPTEIGRRMNLPESTVRSLLNPKAKENTYKARNIADFIKKNIDEKGMIDVGVGVERELKISKENLNAALALLEIEGYPTWGGRVPQVTNAGQLTTLRVACPPGTPHKDIYNYNNINSLNEYVSRDGGETFEKFVYPKSMDSKRLMIRYKDDVGPDGATGNDKDGIVELRRGVDDLSLGGQHYAQVRILVDDSRYIKGMAVYSDNMPDGVDVIFNTNKGSNVPKMEVLKPIKADPDNPFGSLIKPGGQSKYIDKNGEEQLSLINKRADQGDWADWKDALPSQFLGKQSMQLINKQLTLAKTDKLAEFEDICALNNPTIKKHYLEKFADECDSAAVHLKAAALPGQKYHVIIPINTLKDNEVYAPQYENGTELALIRYPHGGTFEIPILRVNNKHVPAKKIIGDTSIDAIGINKSIADRLSGADFDGDTVMAIPTNDKYGRVHISSTRKLDGLKDFDPKEQYGYDDVRIDADGTKHYLQNGMEYRLMNKRTTQKEMGVVSNLITDMTLGGAGPDELARAVRHSMVVIDAEKHHLNYKQSEIDNDISSLKRAYQRSVDENGKVHYGGASTLLSRAKSETSVPKRQGGPIIDPETGKVSYKTADDLYYPDRSYNKKTGEVTIKTSDGRRIKYDGSDREAADKYEPVQRIDRETGEIIFTDKSGTIRYAKEMRKQPSTKMAETDDAYSLVSELRSEKELAYAEYANSMKALANRARKEMVNTAEIRESASAKVAYKAEVASLNTKLNEALLNAPRERMANLRAAAEVEEKKRQYRQSTGENMPAADVKKVSQQAITKYRTEVGSVKRRDRSIEITEKEWEAIQAGAISKSKLKSILNNTDADNLRQRAMPKTGKSLSPAKIAKIKNMSSSNFSLKEIADSIGVSTSTVAEYLKGGTN